MTDQTTCEIRRAEIAAMLANPYERMPKREDLAKQYGVDVRTIYRDTESDEVQTAVQRIIRSYAKSDGLSSAFKIVLAALSGQYGKKEQLKIAMWLIEQTNLFREIEVKDGELFPVPVGGLSKVPHETECDLTPGTGGDNPCASQVP